MKNSFKPNLYLALTHYPVINKNGETIASAVTNLDLHDISRAVKTYGVKRFYVITPLEDQKELVKKIIAHWTHGAGAEYNAFRKEALDLIYIEDSLESVYDHIHVAGNGRPKTVMTSSRCFSRSVNYKDFKDMLKDGEPYLLVFGTAWGLSDTLLASADYILKPIQGNTGYNHLSVRSAVAVILDRLLGN